MANQYESTISLEPFNDGYLVDKKDLLSRNLEARAVNPSTIRQFNGGFKPSMYEPIKIAFVESYTDAGIRIDPKVWDGNNRLFWIATQARPEVFREHQNIFPDGLVYVRDVTTALLSNSYIVPDDEYSADAAGLTPVQFARSIVENVKGREDATLARMAAHFVAIWPSMVGRELSKKYSVTAALMALGKMHEYQSPDDLEELEKNLNHKYYKFIAGETREQREVMKRAFMDLAIISKASGVSRSDLSRYTFTMVVSSNEAIGGESSRRKEILGLLSTPQFEWKLQNFYGDNVIAAEQQRSKMSQVLLDILNKESIVTQEIMTQVLDDTYISPAESALILRSENPIEEYAKIQFDLGFEALKQSLQLTAEEMGVSNFPLDEYVLKRIEEMVDPYSYKYPPKSHENFQVIIQARQMLDDEEHWIHELTMLKEAYLEQGLPSYTFDSEKHVHESLLADLHEHTSPRRMARICNEIMNRRNTTFIVFKNEIERTRVTNTLLNVAEQEGYDVISATGVADSIVKKLIRTNLTADTEIRSILSLPNEMRNEVLEGKLKLSEALQRISQTSTQYEDLTESNDIPDQRTHHRNEVTGKDIEILRNVATFLLSLDEENLRIPEYLREDMERAFDSFGRMLFSKDRVSDIIKAFEIQREEEFRRIVNEIHQRELDKKRERNFS